LGDVLEHLGIEVDEAIAQRAVLDGGPMKHDRGFVLHSDEFTAGEATQDLPGGMRLTATRDVLESIADPDQAPTRYVLALGHCSWIRGQLENELHRNAWLVADLDRAILFDDDQDTKWDRAVRVLGVEPWMLSSEGGQA
jgi:putative transcriptional regulator